MLFILLTGMPGSGKSIFVEVVREEFRIPVYTMGDIIREEAIKKYGEVSPRNMLNTAIELRKQHGSDYIARKTLERVDRRSRAVIIDGIRSLDEVEFFRKNGKTIIIAVHASPRTRFYRLIHRSRPGDPRNWEEFLNRDSVELSLGIGSVIALADYILVNESSIDEFKEIIRRTLSRILHEEGFM